MSRWRSLFTCTILIALIFCLYSLKTGTNFLHAELTPGTPLRLNHTKIATIIEPRSDRLLIPVLHNYIALLPSDWPILIWCSIVNEQMLRGARSLQPHFESGKVTVRLLPDGPSHTRLETVSLSKLLTGTWYWDQLPSEAEYVLIFQTDSVLCSQSTTSVDDWLGYDYVGGPTDWASDGYGGNGGLSIRKITSMKRITREFAKRARGLGKEPEFLWPQDWFDQPELRDGHQYTAEDVFFIYHLRKMQKESSKNDIRWPKDDERDQAEFSLDVWNPARPEMERRPWGVHIGANIQPYVVRFENGSFTPKSQALVNYCPEVLMLRFGMDLPDEGRQAMHEMKTHPEQ